MPNETDILRFEELLSEVTRIGGLEEQTSIITNVDVVTADPAGLTNFMIVTDPRDGDNILAKKVPGVIYADGDKVNVLFIEGTEPVAFQQASESSNSGIWSIVPATSTDIYYDGGNVGLGETVPSTPLHITSNSGEHIRLEHSNASGSPYITFYQQSNRRGYIQQLDTEDNLRITSEYGPVTIWTGSAGAEIERFRVEEDGNVGIGTTVPESNFHLVRDGSGIMFYEDSFNGSPNLIGRRANGSQATPTQVLSGNQLFGFGVRPWFSDTAAYSGSSIGNFAFFAAENITSTTKGTRFTIGTTPTGNNSVQERFRIENTGDVAIGATNALAQLHIDQNSTTGAQPVLYLDQADISEEMIEFSTTIGVGNAIEAVGAKTLTTTHFIKVMLPGALTRYIPVGTIA